MATIPLPRIIFRPTVLVVDATNNKIDFEETVATELTATIPSATYSLAGLKIALGTALNAAGSSVYTVTFANATGLFTITSDGSAGGGIFTLLWDTGTNSATSIGTDIGFVVASDDTGALFYTSDNEAPPTVSLPFTQPIRAPRYRNKRNDRTQISSSGTNESVVIRVDFMMKFQMRHVPLANMPAWNNFMRTAFLQGAQFDFYPDFSNSPSEHIAMIGDATTWEKKETMRDGIGFFQWIMTFRAVEINIDTPAGNNTISTDDLEDRTV